ACSSARAPSGASVRHSNDSAIVVLSFIVPSPTGGVEAHIQARVAHLYETRWGPRRFSSVRIIVIIEFIWSRCRPKPADFLKNQLAFVKAKSFWQNQVVLAKFSVCLLRAA